MFKMVRNIYSHKQTWRFHPGSENVPPFPKTKLVLRLLAVADGPAPSQSSSTSLDYHTCYLSAIKCTWPLRAPCISGVFPPRSSMQMLAPVYSTCEPLAMCVTLRTYGCSVFSMFNNTGMFGEITLRQQETWTKLTIHMTNKAIRL